MTYSVVIRNRNEERFIGHCIQSLVDFLGDKIQVVIVDNESTDNSLRVVNTFDYLDITRLKIDKNDYSPGSSLNYGISICENNVTIVISAHCEIIKWSDIAWDDYTVAVWGKQIPIWDGKKVTPR